MQKREGTVLSEIEEFVLAGNVAHDLASLVKDRDFWIISVSPVYDHNICKSFKFGKVQEKYEQDLAEGDEVIEYPLPIIGFD